MGTKKVNVILRVCLVASTGQWQAVAMDAEGKVFDESEQGSRLVAEMYLENYRRFGAWFRS